MQRLDNGEGQRLGKGELKRLGYEQCRGFTREKFRGWERDREKSGRGRGTNAEPVKGQRLDKREERGT